MHYAPMPAAPGAHPFAPVGEDRVRQIVREELFRDKYGEAQPGSVYDLSKRGA